MSNPAPTLNQINAFNATQGTTIDFNIIGGTEVIRSNKIYIYDLSDNSLICTHLYVSTESIHELPSNTSSSIVYASGKSSADFVNGAQYYAQIQTFTDIAGTEGGSGLSVAKMFWCLDDPTLTIDTIPSTISTTSYNVSATYDANTSVVSNIIQQYQFSLYSATGSLLQSSGVVVGNGEQQGTSTTYDISYNFTGLSVGSSYYVVVEVTTTQGMSVSTRSSTFTVSIDTPTLGEATVVNNACDGYISVTSNLSSEYGGSGSGEIVSFETDSENVFTKLQVDLEPVQNGTPWIGTETDNTPYTFRAVSDSSAEVGNREYDKIVGGTIAWNQLIRNGNFDGSNYWSTTNAAMTISGGVVSATASAQWGRVRQNYARQTLANHRYLVSAQVYGNPNIYVDAGGFGSKYLTKTNAWEDISFMASRTSDNWDVFAVGDKRTSGWTEFKAKNICVFDLTAMFGSTIADYIYNLEQANAGAGVAWFKKLFPKPYYEYNAGELLSVEGLESHDMVGFNQWDEEWENKKGYSTGVMLDSSSNIASKNFIPVVSDTNYYLKLPSGVLVYLYGYDADKNYIGILTLSNGVFNTNTAVYIKFATRNDTIATYNNNICINLSKTTGTPKNGDYVPYVKHTYTLDSDLVLRGLPKLDANNNLYYDGDVYESDGSVTRKYGIVDLGTLTWAATTTNIEDTYRMRGTLPVSAKVPSAQKVRANIVCAKYANIYATETSAGVTGISIDTGGYVRVYDPSYNTQSSANAFAASVSGVYLVYELATLTTETADPYTNPQIVDPDGTEEYVTANDVPVGHDSTYSLVCPISGYDEVDVSVVGKNLLPPQTSDYIYGGITWTLHDDGSMTVKGTATANSIRDFGRGTFKLKAGTYTTNASSSNNVLWAVWRNSSPATLIKNAGGTFTIDEDTDVFVRAYVANGTTVDTTIYPQLEKGTTATTYEPYNGTTYPVSWQTEAGTVYGGSIDVVSGVLTVDRAMVDLGSLNWNYITSTTNPIFTSDSLASTLKAGVDRTMPNAICDSYETVISSARSTLGNSMTNGQFSVIASYASLAVRNDIYTSAADFKSAMSGVQLVYELATPQTYQLTPQQIQTLVGVNNVWSEQGDIELSYHIPITNLLVKRQDVDDVSGNWLALYSQPITQASDMDFTFIDFLNQYGKTYKYALVPLLTQTQSGVVVQIEGGYTVSDNVDSIFDGVYIADQTNVERVKAGVGYGNIDMNQGVGSITPIGSKYPIVITNSQNQYHNGSVRGTIVPNDFYSNGNLSRIDMVNKRDELEQFLTNKRAKIIKDWNGNIWLVMIMSNVNCSFDDNYGMGMVSFSADWLEVGDPTNQQDLYNAGLINVGGV